MTVSSERTNILSNEISASLSQGTISLHLRNGSLVDIMQGALIYPLNVNASITKYVDNSANREVIIDLDEVVYFTRALNLT